MTTIAPLSGWMLDLAAELDEHRAGFAGAYLRASNERRQVIAAYCSAVLPQAEQRGPVADFLLRSNHRDILGAAYGSVPVGFRPALSRAGGHPHDPDFYQELHRLLASPRHSRLAAAIQQMPAIDLPRIRILNILPEDICSPGVVEALGSVNVAKDALQVIDLLIQNGVARDGLTCAINQAKDKKQLTRVWERWAGRCRLPAQPVQAAPGYRPIETVAELRRMARRYQNCSMQFSVEALDGHSAFGEFLKQDGLHEMVVHLRRLNGIWEIDGLFLKQNRRPSVEQRERAHEFLLAVGISQRERPKKAEGQWGSLRRLTSRMLWDLEEED